jgi:alkylated DNA repair dioxygenase AlkB
MRTLFPIHVDSSDVPVIPGLRYLPNYITESGESALVTAIDAAAWDTSWDRRRQPYGAAYGTAKESAPQIPAWGRALAARLFAEGVVERPFDQMLINEYLPGQGIALHRDYEPFDRTVASLSLLSACVMEFRHVADNRKANLLLERRSLLILSDVARYDWEHGIARRKNDLWQGLKIPRARRLSVTFRTRKQRS